MFQHYQGLRWPKGHCAQDVLSQKITILLQMICGKNFRRLSDKDKAVSPERSLFIPLFAGGNDTGWKLLQMSGDDRDMLNKKLSLLIVGISEHKSNESAWRY